LVLLTEHYSGEQIDRNKMSGACSRYGDRRGTCRILEDKLEGKRPLGRTGSGWEYNITTDFRKLDGRHGLD